MAERVGIGVDPNRLSGTIEVVTADEDVLGGGRFGTDTDTAGNTSMLEYLRRGQSSQGKRPDALSRPAC